MSISFHCENCGKKIKAPRGTSGKYGKCPHCNHRNYIPLSKEPGEAELKLAPIDESQETKYAELMQETFSLTEQILAENEVVEQDEKAGGGAKLAGRVSDNELLKHIIVYLSQMTNGHLEAAGDTVKKLSPYKEQTISLLDRLMRASQPEPELEHIPKQVLRGLTENLKQQL